MVLFSSTGTPGKTIKQFEIRPDSQFVVFHGNEHEAPSTQLTGKVVLMNTDPMTVRNIKITLEGRQKVSWIPSTSMSTNSIVQKRTFYCETISLLQGDIPKNSKGHRIGSGNHEWDFKFDLDGSLPESVEGLYDSYVVYSLHAVVERGVLAKDLSAHQHIRVIRTLGQDALMQCAPVENADVWANKISYNVTVPSNAVIFGSAITADIQMTPLRKGLVMGKVQMKLFETIEVKTIAGENWRPGQVGDGSNKRDLDVARMDMEFPADAERIHDVETPDDDYDEAYRFHAKLSLPKSLRQCRQDVDTERIKITHMVRLTVNLHNPEGHVSQLVCKIPIRLFISPNRPVGEDNTVGDIPDHPHEQILNAPTEAAMAPPQYGEHQLDVLYSEIELSGFRTPGVRSGANTPFLHSRNASAENIAAMDDIVDGVASASILHSRLSNLQEQGSSHWARSQAHAAIHTPESYFTSHSGSNSRQSTSQPVSRRHSNEEQEHPSPSGSDDSQVEYDMPALLRTPSYGTAIRTPANRTPPTMDLPTYEAATSRPPSPMPTMPAAPSAPAQAHVHTALRREPSPPGQGERSEERPRRNVSFADLTHGHGEARRWNDHEGEARLRLIRARGA